MMSDDQNYVGTDEFVGTNQKYEDKLSLEDILKASNVADLLDKQDLIRIGDAAVESVS